MQVIFILGLWIVLFAFAITYVTGLPQKIERSLKTEQQEEEQHEYAVAYKPLTQKEIDAIHASGRITPKEKVQEWEDMDLCAPGDAIGSAAWRCEKFHHNCHNCLVDYASSKDSWLSFFDVIKENNFRLRILDLDD